MTKIKRLKERLGDRLTDAGRGQRHGYIDRYPTMWETLIDFFRDTIFELGKRMKKYG